MVSQGESARTLVQAAEARRHAADYKAMNGSSFRFRLERVRALRERSEDAAKQALAAAMQDHHLCSQELERAHERVAQACAAQLEATGGKSTVNDLLARQAYLERVERAVDATQHDLERHERHLEQRREELHVAARDHQALKRLKENRRADHDREAARLEGIVLDEIGINGFRRRAA